MLNSKIRDEDGIITYERCKTKLTTGKKMHGDEGFDIYKGDIVDITYEDSVKVRDNIANQGFYVYKARNYRNILLAIAIIFLSFNMIMAFKNIVALCLSKYYLKGKSDILLYSGKFILGLIVPVVLVVCIIILFFRAGKDYERAVREGSMTVYSFPVDKKVIYDTRDFDIENEHYIVIGNAYVEVGKTLYRSLCVGDRVKVAIFGYNGYKYFALINNQE